MDLETSPQDLTVALPGGFSENKEGFCQPEAISKTLAIAASTKASVSHVSLVSFVLSVPCSSFIRQKNQCPSFARTVKTGHYMPVLESII